MGGDANRLEQVIDDEGEFIGACLVFGKRPRLRVLDVMVGGMDKLHDLVLGAHVIEHVHLGGIAVENAVGDLRERVGKRIRRGGLRRCAAIKVLGAHVERAAHEIAPAIGKVGVVNLLHALKADGAIGTRHDVGHEVIAIALDTKQIDDVGRSDSVTAALGHLLRLARLGIAHGKETVSKNVLGQALSDRHKHGGPDHAMETNDVLAHDVVLGGPAVRELGTRLGRIDTITHGGHVVEKRIEPDVGHMTLVKRHRNTPVKARAAHRKIVKAALDKATDLVHAERGLDKIGMLVIELEQFILERGKLEEVGLLLHALERTMAVGAQVLTLATVLLVALLDLGLGEVGLVGNAIPTVVAALVQVARFLHALPEVLHGMTLAWLGSADKIVIGDLELFPKVLEVRSLAIGPLLRSHAMLGSGLGNLLTMLVHAGQELDVVAGGATIARLHVGKNRRIRRSQMRIGIDVVNRRGDKERRLCLAHRRTLSMSYGCGLMTTALTEVDFTARNVR